MGQKARSGGTLGRARLGYLNHVDRSGGRDVRTVIADPVGAPLVRLGFELFATDNYTLTELATCSRPRPAVPTQRPVPTQRVSISKLAHMLRDRYYLGYISYKGEEIPGRHVPSSMTIFSTTSNTSESHEPRHRNAAACTTTT